MDHQLQNFISSIEESHLPKNEKTALVTTLQKDGVTQKFADLFKESLASEMQKRGEAAGVMTTDFDAQFAQLLEQFEEEGIALERELSEKVSALDPLDTAGEQTLLDTYTTTLKKQQMMVENKVRDLTVQFAKATEKLL